MPTGMSLNQNQVKIDPLLEGPHGADCLPDHVTSIVLTP